MAERLWFAGHANVPVGPAATGVLGFRLALPMQMPLVAIRHGLSQVLRCGVFMLTRLIGISMTLLYQRFRICDLQSIEVRALLEALPILDKP